MRSQDKLFLLEEQRPLVWAFIPFGIEGQRLVGDTYDTADTKAELAAAFHSLGLPWIWQPLVRECLDEIIEQVSRERTRRDVLIFNFCDGDDVNGRPGLSVVRALEAARIPFTGADSRFYDASTSKVQMKERFLADGVPTAPFAVLPHSGPVQGVCHRLGVPLFVKPSVSFASHGISLASVVFTDQQAASRRDHLRSGPWAHYFAGDTIFAERFIDGSEFTVFVGGYWDQPDENWFLPPAQRVFDESIPDSERFLSFDRYWGHFQEESPPALGRPFCRYEPCPLPLARKLAGLANRAYCVLHGTGYGRVDIRQDRHSGKFYVLEVNSNCGISGDDQTSTGCLLKLAGLTLPALLASIIHQTLLRAAWPAPRPAAHSLPGRRATTPAMD